MRVHVLTCANMLRRRQKIAIDSHRPMPPTLLLRLYAASKTRIDDSMQQHEQQQMTPP